MSTSDSWNAIFQNCWYVGNNFNAILYGVELVLYFTTVKLLLDGRARRARCKGANAPRRKEKSSFYVTFGLSTGFLFMITVYLFAQNFFGQEMWIINAGYAGGSAAYYARNAAVWYQTMGSASSVVLNWMSDAYFIYRVYVVWNGRWQKCVIMVPCALYVGTLVLGVLTCYFSGRPGGDFFVGIAPRIAMAYSAVGIVMNFICTALISGRILYVPRRIANILNSGTPEIVNNGVPKVANSGVSEVANSGVSEVANSGASEAVNTSGGGYRDKLFHKIALTIVESMLPYTLFGVAYVVSLALVSPVSILFLSLYVMFTCLSPQMLMLCMAMGREWRDERTSTASRETASLQFVKPAKSQASTGFSETCELHDLERDADASLSVLNSHASSSTHT